MHRAPNHEIPRRYHSHHANHTPSHVPGGLVRLVMGGKSAIRSHVHKLIEHPHLLLYLTLDINEEDPDEKVLNYYMCTVNTSTKRTYSTHVRVCMYINYHSTYCACTVKCKFICMAVKRGIFSFLVPQLFPLIVFQVHIFMYSVH